MHIPASNYLMQLMAQNEIGVDKKRKNQVCRPARCVGSVFQYHAVLCSREAGVCTGTESNL